MFLKALVKECQEVGTRSGFSETTEGSRNSFKMEKSRSETKGSKKDEIQEKEGR